MRPAQTKLFTAARAALAAAMTIFSSDVRSSEDSFHYQKRSTWQESMLASADAIAMAAMEDGLGYESATMRGGDPAQRIAVDVSGLDEIWLFVTGCPDVKWGVADWAEAVFIPKGGRSIPLSSLKTLDFVLGRHETNLTLRSGLYQKMRMGARQFEHGLNVQANSVVRVPLGKQYDKFEAWIGVDAWAGTNGNVRFSVLTAKSAARKQLWDLLQRDFPDGRSRLEMNWEREDRVYEEAWKPGDVRAIAARYAAASRRIPALAKSAEKFSAVVRGEAALQEMRQVYYRSRALYGALQEAAAFDFEAVNLAINDLEGSGKYPKTFGQRLGALEKELRKARTARADGALDDLDKLAGILEKYKAVRDEALRANPLLDFDRLMLVKRRVKGEARRAQWEGFGLGEYLGVPRQSSWANGTMPNVDKWTNEIDLLSPVGPGGKLSTLFKPEGTRLVADVDLHFDGSKLLFSMPNKTKQWQVCEVQADGSGFRQLTLGDPDVHFYDPCYLPSGKILCVSTAPLQGVPCNAGVIVGMMYQMNADGGNLHQICFEQDHDYNPSVMNDGRVLYLRWDYTDTPHIWNRILFTMNPDGSSQLAYYGGNSYWPNAVFYPRAIPGHPTKIAGIVTGHHEGRVGELVVFDPAKGTQETDGVVQRIPGRGKKVEPRIEDKLTEHSWPKFLHPWPLSEKYFLVSCKPEPDSLWGIYLVDTFDNMTLLKEEEGWALLEPIPFRPRPTPPSIPDHVQPAATNSLVYLENVYFGPGLKGVPPGAVKSLRLFTYHFGYQTLAGIDNRVGADGPWETKRVLGTVPVEADGSAWFRIPPKTPISVQPLDKDGKALALMRSWMTAQPGENLSCIGCHERSSAAPPGPKALALKRPPSEITPWEGPARGFSFAREVQPVLDKHCVRCHNGEQQGSAPVPDLRADQGGFVVYEHGKIDGYFVRGASKEQLLGKFAAVFEPSYALLRQFVRVGGLESDLHILPAKEFHADTSELIQMLQKGHYGVCLDPASWDRLITWIDLNAPCHGTWQEVTKLPGRQRERRLELRKMYGGVLEDCEADAAPPVQLASLRPLDAKAARREKYAPAGAATAGYQARSGTSRPSANNGIKKGAERVLKLPGGLKMELVEIPAGEFMMGDAAGFPDEQPVAKVRIGKSFWMGVCEVSNEQFGQFDSSHDSRFEHRTSWIFSEEYLGWRLNNPRQPVVRVSWEEAMEFCKWLSRATGERVTLPTEAQWEYACRASSSTPLSFGDLDTDFSRYANMGDISLRKLADEGWRPKAPDLVPRDDRFNDGALVTCDVGRYLPNAWGLHDMHGNAAEWTCTTYKPHPYGSEESVEIEANPESAKKVVRGGSWRDRPKLCRSGSRVAYSPWQKVYNVGFRVIVEE